MRSIKWAVASVVVGGLLGCGGPQPTIYRVAVDRLSQDKVATTCYRPGSAPTTTPDRTSNMIDQEQWVIWEGIDGLRYLDVGGNINYGLGQAERVDIDGEAIVDANTEDDANVFTTERVRTDSATEVYTTSATYTFEELGKTIKGTLALRSNCAGADCGGIPSCDVTLNFSGRQIDTDQFSFYTPDGND
jgi:hypothetical protein